MDKKRNWIISIILMLLIAVSCAFVVQADNSKSTVKIQNTSNSISIKKVDALTGNAVSGITFNLNYLNGTKYKSATTDSNGIVTFSKISDGDYQVKEIATTNGYLLNSKVEGITVKNGVVYDSKGNVITNTIAFTFENSRNSFKLVKTDKETGNALEGAEFDINGTKYTTDSNGEISLDSLKGTKDGLTYTVKETKAPTYQENGVTYNYALDETEYQFVVYEDGSVSLLYDNIEEKNKPNFTYDEDEHLISLIVKDEVNHEELNTNVKLTKTSSFDETTLSGAEFTLDKLDALATETQFPITATTDENGEISFIKIPIGNYTLTETKAPAGYNITTEPIEFEITAEDCYNSTTIDESVLLYAYEFEVEDTPTNYAIHKVVSNEDGETYSSLENVGFLFYKEGTEGDADIALDAEGNAVKNNTTLYTDEYGYIKLYALSTGEYKYYETEVSEDENIVIPTDDEGNPIVYTLTVAEDNSMTLKSSVSDEIKNIEADEDGFFRGDDIINNRSTDYKGNIFIEKVDDNDVIIKEAEFDIFEWSAELEDYKAETLTTIKYSSSASYMKSDEDRANGYYYYTTSPLAFTEDNLGKFKIVETKTKTGYAADWSQEIQFDLAGNEIEQEFSFKVVNTKNSIVVLKVDSKDPTKTLSEAEFTLESYTTTGAAPAYQKSIKMDAPAYSAEFSELSPGYYKLYETCAPDHYLLSDEVMYFIVNQDGTIVQATLPEEGSADVLTPIADAKASISCAVNFPDDYDSFTIHKVDEADTTKALKDVQFKFVVYENKNGDTQEEQPALAEGTIIGYLEKGTKIESTGSDETDPQYGVPVYQNDVIATDENGYISIKMLIDGRWEYSEISVPSPYILPVDEDGEPYISVLNVEEGFITDSSTTEPVADLEVKITNTDKQIFGEIRIEKLDAATKEKLSGAAFDVYGWSEKNQDYTKYVTTLIEDTEKGEGYYKTEEESLEITRSNKGKFKIIESEAPSGYIATYEQTIELTKDGNYEIELYEDLAATNEESEFDIKKVEAASRRPLKGAEFQVWVDGLAEGEVICKDSDGNDVLNYQTFTTDSSGILKFTKLSKNTIYSFKEIKAPAGFAATSKIYHICVDKKGYVYEGNQLEVPETFTASSDGQYTIVLTDGPGYVADQKIEISLQDSKDKDIIGYAVDSETGEKTALYNGSIVTTNDEGQVIFEKLKADAVYEYTLVENDQHDSLIIREVANSLLMNTGGAGRYLIYGAGAAVLIIIIIVLVVSKKKNKDDDDDD